MEGQIIQRRNVYTSYGKSVETKVSLDKVVNDLRFFNPDRRVDRGAVEFLLLNGEEIWTINSTYFLKGGRYDKSQKRLLKSQSIQGSRKEE